MLGADASSAAASSSSNQSKTPPDSPDEAHRRAVVEFGELLGDANRLLDAPPLVDQVPIFGFGAGEDTPFRRAPRFGRREAAPFGDPLQEEIVDGGHFSADPLAGRRVPGDERRLVRGAAGGVRPGRADGLDVHAEPFEGRAERELASDDADRSHDAGGLGDDAVGGRREVVPAARRHVADRDDDGLLGAKLHQRAPEEIRRERRAARGIDAQDDRLRAGVVGQRADGAAERALADARASVRRRSLRSPC